MVEVWFWERDILLYIGGLFEGFSKVEFCCCYIEVDSLVYCK